MHEVLGSSSVPNVMKESVHTCVCMCACTHACVCVREGGVSTEGEGWAIFRISPH